MQIQDLTHLGQADRIARSDGEDVKQGLTQFPKTLPPKYFYDARGSELFEQICELPEYYPSRTEAWILHQYSDTIAQTTGASELVELGSGSSTKTRLLLKAYREQGYSCKYVPIDVSETILKNSAIQLQNEYPTLQIQALIGTYQQALSYLKPTAWPCRTLFFLGSSIGNFSPKEYNLFLDKIAGVLSAGDYFLLGIDLQKPKSVLEAAYNDSQGVTAAFNLNILSHLNWRFQGNFDPNLFSHKAVYNSQENQIEMYLCCQKSHVVTLASLDLEIAWEAGESILTEISRKFDLDAVQEQLNSKGLKTLEAFTDPKQWFGLILCQAVH